MPRYKNMVGNRLLAIAAVKRHTHIYHVPLTVVSYETAVSVCLIASTMSIWKRKGTYLIKSIPEVCDSFWRGIDKGSCDRELFHFLSLSRSSFEKLVEVCEKNINYLPICSQWNSHFDSKKPRTGDLKKRKYKARDIISMTLRFLLSRAEFKDLCPLFGCTDSVFSRYVKFGMEVFIHSLIS